MGPLVAVFGTAVVLGTAAVVGVLVRSGQLTRWRPLVAMIGAGTTWSAGGLAAVLAVEPAQALGAFVWTRPAFGVAAVALLWYALDLAGYRNPWWVAIAVVLDPGALLLVAIVPEWHQVAVRVVTGPDGLPALVNGPLVALEAVVSGALAVAGTGVLLVARSRAVVGHRRRYGAAAVALGLPTFAALGGVVAGVGPLTTFACASVGFLVALVGFASRVLHRPDMADPLGVHQVLGVLGDAVVVIDGAGTVVQANPAALDLGRRWPGGPPWHRLDSDQQVIAPDGSVLDLRVTRIVAGDHRSATVITARDVTEVEALRAELADLAERDGLTGLRNRRYLDRVLPALVADAAAGGRPMSAAMIDLDRFKLVNDRFGHAAGDRVLVAVAGALSGLLRGDDVLVRFGGEELLVLLPGAGVAELAGRAEQWRAACARIGLDGGPPGVVTVSIGLAQVAPGDGVDDLLRAADAAMYAAKQAGRNRVVTAPVGRR